MPYREISHLKNTGCIEEAYVKARQCIECEEADVNIIRIFASISLQLIQQYIAQKKWNECLCKIADFALLDIPTDETGIYKNIVTGLRAFVNKLVESPHPNLSLMDQCFESIYPLSLHYAGLDYTLFVKSVLKLKTWQRLNEFAFWCGIDHLREDDFIPYKLENGRQIMALAEQLSIKIAKYLIDQKNIEKIKEFIPKLESLYQANPRYTYPPYFLTQLYVVIGDTNSAKRVLLPFIQKKSRDFWVWQRMAELYDNLEDKIMFYCKAIECGSRKPEMLSGLYEQSAIVFIKNKNWKMAKWLIQSACSIRANNHWHISPELLDLTRQSWYTETPSQYDESFVMEQSKKAEQMALGRAQNNRNKQPKAPNNESKKFSGKIKITHRGFGFVHDATIGDVFIPESLTQSIVDDMCIRGIAKKKFDKKKQQWSYAAIKLN